MDELPPCTVEDLNQRIEVREEFIHHERLEKRPFVMQWTGHDLVLMAEDRQWRYDGLLHVHGVEVLKQPFPLAPPIVWSGVSPASLDHDGLRRPLNAAPQKTAVPPGRHLVPVAKAGDAATPWLWGEKRVFELVDLEWKALSEMPSALDALGSPDAAAYDPEHKVAFGFYASATPDFTLVVAWDSGGSVSRIEYTSASSFWFDATNDPVATGSGAPATAVIWNDARAAFLYGSRPKHSVLILVDARSPDTSPACQWGSLPTVVTALDPPTTTWRIGPYFVGAPSAGTNHRVLVDREYWYPRSSPAGRHEYRTADPMAPYRLMSEPKNWINLDLLLLTIGWFLALLIGPLSCVSFRQGIRTAEMIRSESRRRPTTARHFGNEALVRALRRELLQCRTLRLGGLPRTGKTFTADAVAAWLRADAGSWTDGVWPLIVGLGPWIARWRPFGRFALVAVVDGETAGTHLEDEVWAAWRMEARRMADEWTVAPALRTCARLIAGCSEPRAWDFLVRTCSDHRIVPILIVHEAGALTAEATRFVKTLERIPVGLLLEGPELSGGDCRTVPPIGPLDAYNLAVLKSFTLRKRLPWATVHQVVRGSHCIPYVIERVLEQLAAGPENFDVEQAMSPVRAELREYGWTETDLEPLLAHPAPGRPK